MQLPRIDRYLGGSFLASVIAFIVSMVVLQPGTVTMVVNGAFAGAVVGVCVAYARLFRDVMTNDAEFDRSAQFATGVLLLWGAYCISAGTSVYLLMSDFPDTPSYFTASNRFLAIWAAIIQVTSPDYGFGLFHGRDRKVLWVAFMAGMMIAVIVALAQ